MRELLSKLNELIGIAEVRIKKCEEERQQHSQRISVVENREKAVDIVEKELVEREKNVKVYENISEAQAELKIDQQRNQDMIASLKKREAELEKAKSAHDKKVSDDKAEIERQKEKLAKQSAEIEKKAKTYKDEVLAAVAKQVEKK